LQSLFELALRRRQSAAAQERLRQEKEGSGVQRVVAGLPPLALFVAQAGLDGAHRASPEGDLLRALEAMGDLGEAVVSGGTVRVEGQGRQVFAAGRLPPIELLERGAQLLVILRRPAVERDRLSQKGNGPLQVRLGRVAGEGSAQGEGVLGIVRLL